MTGGSYCQLDTERKRERRETNGVQEHHGHFA